MDPDDCEDEDEEDEDEDDEGCGNGVADWLPPPPICCMAQPLTINRTKQIEHNLFADNLTNLYAHNISLNIHDYNNK